MCTVSVFETSNPVVDVTRSDHAEWAAFFVFCI